MSSKEWYQLELHDVGDDSEQTPDAHEKSCAAREEIASALWRWVEQTESLPAQCDRRDNVRLCMKIYSNRNEPGLDYDAAGGSILDGFTYNQQPELRALIDSQHSIVGKNRPKATVLTSGGDWEMQHVATQLDQFLWHEFIRTKFHQKGSKMALYAEVTGDGVLHFYIDWDRKAVMVEHVLISEITVDERTVAPGELPPMLTRTRYVNKEKLKARFPDFEKEIEESAACLPFPGETELPQDAGMVAVIEGWHLPPVPGAQGHYALVTKNTTLVFTSWKHDFYPFLDYKWKDPLTGFYGIGLVQEEFGAQAELDFLDDRISQSINVCAVPRTWLPSGMEVSENVITNEIGTIIQTSGPGTPTFQVGQALSAEVYDYRKSVAEGMQRRSGTGAMAVDGTPPAQVEAARAMREMADSQLLRLSSPSQRYEDTVLEGAWIFLVFNKELYTSLPDEDDESEFEADGLADAIDWEGLELDRNKLQLEIEASSRLSMSPSSKLASAIELKQYGVNVPDGVFMRLLNLPDVKEETKRMSAQVEYTEWLIGQKLLKGIYVAPNPLMDLVPAIDRVIAASLDAEMRGAPEEILAVFRQWVGDAQTRVNEAMAPPPAPPMIDPATGMPMDPAMAAAPPPVDPATGLPLDPAMAGLPPGPLPDGGMPPGLPPAPIPVAA